MKLVAAAAAIVVAGIATSGPYLDGPPPAHTGGFGEATCVACHFDAPLNDADGRLVLEGLAEEYQPGAAYTLQLRLEREGLGRGGFQMAARYADGPLVGLQAGTLKPLDDRVARDSLRNIQYVRHTRAGTLPAQPDSISWRVAWTAPPADSGRVTFHVAANAANGDDSEFGDFIYVAEYIYRPAAEPGSHPRSAPLPDSLHRRTKPSR